MLWLFPSRQFNNHFSNDFEDAAELWKGSNQLYYPLCDENGDRVGEVTAYAMIPQGSQCKEEVYQFISYYLFELMTGDGGCGDSSPCSAYAFEHITRYWLENSKVSEEHIEQYLDLLENYPKRLYFGGEGRNYMREQIKGGLTGDMTWEEVASAVDLYLIE